MYTDRNEMTYCDTKLRRSKDMISVHPGEKESDYQKGDL